jgi:4-amino-4-deoxy-L-arabinose transferase-like glycosyltransferase
VGGLFLHGGSSSIPVGGKAAAFLLLLLAAGLLLFGRLGSPLLEPEDALFAEIPREMLVEGHWIVPVHHGQADYQKPPLLYWLIMASYAVFGVHEWSARLIPCASALGTILVTFWWGNRALGFRGGLAGAFILCLSARFLYQARMITTDGLLCFWVVTAWAIGHRAIRAPRLNVSCFVLSASACALGILTKGPVALALVAVPLFVDHLLRRSTIWSMLSLWPAYVATALGLASPWFAIMAWREPGFLREFFWTHHVVMRFLRPLHEEPAWFYLPVLLLGTLPWTLLLPALIRLLLRRSESTARQCKAALGFPLLCCLWCLVFFSAASCKRVGYILPAMPTLALAVGYALDRQLAAGPLTACGFFRGVRAASWPYWGAQGVLAVGIVGALVASSVGLAKPASCLAMAALAAAGMGCLVYRGRRQTLQSSWVACALSTFAVLFLAIHVLLPGYYRKFSLRAELRSPALAIHRSRATVICYPHLWDSVTFYLGHDDVRAYGLPNRNLLIGDLHSRPESVLMVKSGHVLNDLLRALPDSLEFVPIGGPGLITAGVVHQRTQVAAQVSETSPRQVAPEVTPARTRSPGLD